MLSGCFMVPMALIGPATSGYTTASILQSGVSMTANYVVKKSTGKAISQHVLDAISDGSVDNMKQSYFPDNEKTTLAASESRNPARITPR